MTKTKEVNLSAVLTVSDIANAYVLFIAGQSLHKIARQYKTTSNFLTSRFEALENLIRSDDKALSIPQQEIKEILAPQLEKIKAALTITTHDNLVLADTATKEALIKEQEAGTLKSYTGALIADLYEKRFERLTKIGSGGNPQQNNIMNFIRIDAAIAKKNNINIPTAEVVEEE